MLVEIYVALSLVSFASLFAAILIKDAYKMFFAFISILMFFYLAFSSGFIQENYCELPMINSTSNSTFVCQTDVVDTDMAEMIFFAGMGMISLIIVFMGIFEFFARHK